MEFKLYFFFLVFKIVINYILSIPMNNNYYNNLIYFKHLLGIYVLLYVLKKMVLINIQTINTSLYFLII